MEKKEAFAGFSFGYLEKLPFWPITAWLPK